MNGHGCVLVGLYSRTQLLILCTFHVSSSIILLIFFPNHLKPKRVAQLVGASFCKLKGHGFNSPSGPMPGVRVQSPVGAYERQPVNVSLLFFLPYALSRIRELGLGRRLKKPELRGYVQKRVAGSIGPWAAVRRLLHQRRSWGAPAQV